LSAPLANNPPAFPEPPLAPFAAPALTEPAQAAPHAPTPPPPPAAGPVPSDVADGGREGVGAWLAESGIWAWLSSAVVHALLVIILSLILLSTPTDEPLWVMGAFEEPTSTDVDMDLSEIPIEGTTPSLGEFELGDEVSLPGARSTAIGASTGSPTASTPAVGSFKPSLSADALAPVGEVAAGGIESLVNPLASTGGGLEGRTLENRRAAALSGGGTEQSEAAVEAALAWLAEHQWPDGGWRFDLEKCPSCSGYCRNSGTHTSTTAATGLALLSFLGAGYTHQEGKYQNVVGNGLYYLREQMTITSMGGDLRDKKADLEAEIPGGGLLNPMLANARRDSMYSHGIATLALTEAYAMTRDKGYREPAELAIKFIVNAQYDDGGWRYAPKYETIGPGDMTVSGWQIAALKSASLAGIEIPYEVWMKINEFLDGIQDDSGATYLYLARENRGTAATTAIGLLCRMINGWPRDHKPLQRGVAKLGDQQPTRNNMYFNYYASQVLHHVGGPNWDRWNPKMREYLIKTQATEGHEVGSWYFPESHSTPGGRLYTTAMATMTLEVYYRYMPIYQDAFVDRAP
jgi:hypothetical protein